MTLSVGVPQRNPAQTRSRRSALAAASRSLLANWGAVLGIGALWEVAGHVYSLRWLPPLSQVLREIVRLFASNTLPPLLLSSLAMFALGLLAAVIVGLLVGTAMGISKHVFSALDVFVNSLFVTPSLIFAPILFAIFGLSDLTRVSVVFLYGVFVIIINTAAAFRTVPPSLLVMSASFGASRLRALYRVAIPAAFPMTLAGFRLAVGRGVKGMVNGEMFIALVGIGGMVSQASRQHQYVTVWAVSLTLMLLAIGLNMLVGYAEKRLTGWVG